MRVSMVWVMRNETHDAMVRRMPKVKISCHASSWAKKGGPGG
ncbi:hypothetical protein [Methanogenium cariaci]|nr:hypothetical protein [Methanogenium cariaci]